MAWTAVFPLKFGARFGWEFLRGHLRRRLNNHGAIFKITSSGTLTPLYSFTNGVDGSQPECQLVEASPGVFFGTATNGGADQYGTVFEITSAGAFTTLYNFTNGADGSMPVGGLALGHDGNLYGTAYNGGSNLFGALFEITPGGTFTPLFSFSGMSDGANPFAPMILGADGAFCGTTSSGGQSFGGTAFRFGAPVLVETHLTSITRVGGTVSLSWSEVLGQDYQVQTTTNLAQTNWSAFGPVVTGNNGTGNTFDVITNTVRFYRVRTYLP